MHSTVIHTVAVVMPQLKHESSLTDVRKHCLQNKSTHKISTQANTLEVKVHLKFLKGKQKRFFSAQVVLRHCTGTVQPKRFKMFFIWPHSYCCSHSRCFLSASKGKRCWDLTHFVSGSITFPKLHTGVFDLWRALAHRKQAFSERLVII